MKFKPEIQGQKFMLQLQDLFLFLFFLLLLQWIYSLFSRQVLYHKTRYPGNLVAGWLAFILKLFWLSFSK